MTNEWFVDKIINGRKCRIYHSEWSYIGGSTIKTTRMEYLNEDIGIIKKNIHKRKGGRCGKSKK